MTPLKYLKEQLNFITAEWKGLGKEGQETLKQWAIEEMNYRNLEVK